MGKSLSRFVFGRRKKQFNKKKFIPNSSAPVHSVEENRKCFGKSQFATESEAVRTARRVMDQYGDEMRSYKCDVCPFWHNGHRRRSYHDDV